MVDLTAATLAIAATNILVGFATVSLAIVAYKQMREARRQARQQLTVLSDQTAILRSQQDPLLKAHAFNFNGNELIASITNRGKGRARRIGIESRFYPAVFEPTDEKGNRIKITEQMLEDYKKKGQGVPGRYSEKPEAPLRHEKWQNGEAWYYVSFLASQLTGDAILDPTEDQEFRLHHREPMFKIWLDDDHFVHLGYSDLKQVIRDSGFRFVSIWLRIVCKDSVDRPVHGQSFRFIADVDEHQTLQEAMSKGGKPTLFAIDAHQVETELGGIDGEIYKLERSMENLPLEQRDMMEREDKSRGSRFFKRRSRKKSWWSKLRRKP